MATKNYVKHEYKNENNGGRERVYRIDGKYYISSDWGTGFHGKTEVSKNDMQDVLAFTNAPKEIAEDILI